MSTKTTNKEQRRIEDTYDTARPEIKLKITTSHDRRRKEIHVRVSRVEQTGIGCREKFSMRNDDPCPVEPVRVPVARYSLAALENVHANFISNRVAGVGQIATLKEWAERYRCPCTALTAQPWTISARSETTTTSAELAPASA